MRQLRSSILAFMISIFLLSIANTTAMAQQDQKKFRIAKIEVDMAPIAIAIKPAFVNQDPH